MIPNEIGLPRNGAPGMTTVLDEPSSASAATCEPLLTRGRGPSKQGFWPQRRKREMTPTRDTTHPNEAAFPRSLRACASRIGACRYWLHGSTRAAFGGRIARATRDGPKALRILRSALAQQGRHLRESKRPQRRSGLGISPRSNMSTSAAIFLARPSGVFILVVRNASA